MADVKQMISFYEYLTNVGVRLTHQFQMSVVGTNNLPPEVEKNLKDVTFWAQGTQLPGRTQNEAPISYLGYTFNVPTNFVMTNQLNFTVNTPFDMHVREGFLAWMAHASAPDIEDNTVQLGGGDKRIPSTVIVLDLLNYELTDKVATYELYGAYPTDVGVIELTNADPTIASFTVTLRFQLWKAVSNSLRDNIPTVVRPTNPLS